MCEGWTSEQQKDELEVCDDIRAWTGGVPVVLGINIWDLETVKEVESRRYERN